MCIVNMLLRVMEALDPLLLRNKVLKGARTHPQVCTFTLSLSSHIQVLHWFHNISSGRLLQKVVTHANFSP